MAGDLQIQVSNQVLSLTTWLSRVRVPETEVVKWRDRLSQILSTQSTDSRERLSTHARKCTEKTLGRIYWQEQSVWIVASVVGVVIKVERDVLVLHCACVELIEHAVGDVGEEKMLQIQRVVTTGSCKENHTLLWACKQRYWRLFYGFPGQWLYLLSAQIKGEPSIVSGLHREWTHIKYWEPVLVWVGNTRFSRDTWILH